MSVNNFSAVFDMVSGFLIIFKSVYNYLYEFKKK